MNPFSVTCETCRAKLKVRSERAIGEIHACPRCGSMVHIAPPPGWPANDTGMPGAAGKLSAPVEFLHVRAPSEAAANAFADAAARAVDPSPTFDLPPENLNGATTQPAIQSNQTTTEGVVAGAASSAKIANLIPWVGLGISMLVAGGLAIAWITSSRPDSSPPATGAVGAVANIASSAPVEVATDSTPENAGVSIDRSSDSNSSDHVAEEARQDTVEAMDAPRNAEPPIVALPPIEAADDSSNEPRLVAASNRTESASIEPETSAVAPESEPQRRTVLRFDPLDFDPAQLRWSDAASAADKSATSSLSEMEMSEAVASDEGSEKAADDADLIAAAANNSTITMQRGPMVRHGVKPLSVARQLSMPIASLEVSGMPLDRFLAMASEMANVPITVDPTALELAGVSPQAPTTIEVRQATLDELVQTALAKHRLSLIDRDGHLVIALAGGEKRSIKRYDVTDLIESDTEDGHAIARLIRQFVSPQTWLENGGPGILAVEGNQLRIEQSKEIHHELLIFCERLRMARGLKPRSKYPANLISTGSSYLALQPLLNQRATFTHLRWTRWSDVVRHWEISTGLTIHVDWSRLAEFELFPSTPIACSATDRPWREVLDEILKPLQLTWRAVGGETIQITTENALHGIDSVEFYKISEEVRAAFTSDKAFVAALRTEIQQHVGNEVSDSGQPHLHFDAGSNHLICRASPHVHRFLSQRFSGDAEPGAFEQTAGRSR